VSVLTVCAKPVARVTQSPASKGGRYGLFRRVAYRSPPFNRSICFPKNKKSYAGGDRRLIGDMGQTTVHGSDLAGAPASIKRGR